MSTFRYAWLMLALVYGCASDTDETPEEGTAPEDAEVAMPESDAGCSLAVQTTPGIVRIDATGEFTLNGSTFVPRGLNSYPLLQHLGNGRVDLVQDILNQAKQLERPLLRTMAFLDIGTNPARIRDDQGNLRPQGLEALDRLLFEADAHGVRLILTLTNNWEDFGGAPAVVKMIAPSEKLPKNAFWSDPRAIDAQLAYQSALATRVNSLNGRIYREDPTIFAWELANEPRCERNLFALLCGDSTLVKWARRMSDGLRTAGVQQLIAWGGGGYLGEYGEDLRAIASEGGVDVLTLHMYATAAPAVRGASRAEAAIMWGEATLRERAAVARAAGMPLLLEEVNWKPDANSDRDGERATVLDAWLRVAQALRVGTLPWMIGERGRSDYDGYLIRPEDVATAQVLRCEQPRS